MEKAELRIPEDYAHQHRESTSVATASAAVAASSNSAVVKHAAVEVS
jgi:hypothetical protein